MRLEMSNLVLLPKMSERESTNTGCDQNAKGYVLRSREKFFLERFSLIVASGAVQNTRVHWGTARNLLIREVFVGEDNLEVQIGNLQKPKENSLPGTQNVII